MRSRFQRESSGVKQHDSPRWRGLPGFTGRHALRGSLAVLGLLFAWWEGSHPWPSGAAHLSIIAAIGVIFALAIMEGRHRQRLSNRAWLSRIWAGIRRPTQRSWCFLFGAVVWVILVLAVAGWDFRSFLLEVPSLPTLSYLIGRVSRFATGRSLLVAAWLALGVFFVLANRVHITRNDKRTSANLGDQPLPPSRGQLP